MQINIYSVQSLQSFISKDGPNLHLMVYLSQNLTNSHFMISQAKSLCRFKKDFGFNVTMLETRG